VPEPELEVLELEVPGFGIVETGPVSLAAAGVEFEPEFGGDVFEGEPCVGPSDNCAIVISLSVAHPRDVTGEMADRSAKFAAPRRTSIYDEQ
jgi:hypothetical protein